MKENIKETGFVKNTIDWFIGLGCKILKVKPDTFVEIFLYLFFGFVTTVLNIAIDMSLRMGFGALNLPFDPWFLTVVIAWVLCVIFAFVTNKIFVFKSKDYNIKTWVSEGIPFLFARLLSLGLEYSITFVMLTLMGVNALIVKIIAQIVVIIVNYVASKLVVFKTAK